MKIKQDIHVHTHLSPCAERDQSAQFLIDRAKRQGLELVGFADHMWDNGHGYGIASYERHHTNFANLIQIKEEIAGCTIPQGIRVLVGCETDFTADSTLGISREVAAQLDFVLASQAHSHFPEVCPPDVQEDRIACGKFSLDAFIRLMKHPDIDIVTAIPHPMATHYVSREGGDSDILAAISDAEFREAFLLAAEKGIGIEINSLTVRSACNSTHTDLNDCNQIKNLEYFRMFSIAKEVGCRFTFGSDSHSSGAYDYLPYAQAMADALELKEKDVILL